MSLRERIPERAKVLDLGIRIPCEGVDFYNLVEVHHEIFCKSSVGAPSKFVSKISSFGRDKLAISMVASMLLAAPMGEVGAVQQADAKLSKDRTQLQTETREATVQLLSTDEMSFLLDITIVFRLWMIEAAVNNILFGKANRFGFGESANKLMYRYSLYDLHEIETSLDELARKHLSMEEQTLYSMVVTTFLLENNYHSTKASASSHTILPKIQATRAGSSRAEIILNLGEAVGWVKLAQQKIIAVEKSKGTLKNLLWWQG